MVVIFVVLREVLYSGFSISVDGAVAKNRIAKVMAIIFYIPF